MWLRTDTSNPKQSWELHHDACGVVQTLGRALLDEAIPGQIGLFWHHTLTWKDYFGQSGVKIWLENGSQCRQTHLDSLQGLIHGIGWTQCRSLWIRENHKQSFTATRQLLCTATKGNSRDVLCFHDWQVGVIGFKTKSDKIWAVRGTERKEEEKQWIPALLQHFILTEERHVSSLSFISRCKITGS